jgi:hypothetical protein
MKAMKFTFQGLLYVVVHIIAPYRWMGRAASVIDLMVFPGQGQEEGDIMLMRMMSPNQCAMDRCQTWMDMLSIQ